jgi:predicted ATPase
MGKNNALEDSHTAISSLSYTNVDEINSESIDRNRKLYGRTHESQQLLRIYDDVVSHNCSKTVIIHGSSGSGKTSLVEAFRDIVCDDNAFFCSGKFFQNVDVHEPYSAFTAAFSDLCDIMGQAGELQEHRWKIVQDELGANFYNFSRMISVTSPWCPNIETSEIVGETKNDAAFLQFKISCRRFLRAVSSPEHPIVIFIDDIQWMDNGSKQLLDFLISDDHYLQNILIIISYRDEESDAIPDFVKDVENNSSIIKIFVNNLDKDAVLDLLSDKLQSKSNEINKFSEILWLKTAGNTFQILQLLDSIQVEGLLIYDTSSNEWKFDVEKIQEQIQVSESLVNLVLQKVQRSSPETQLACKIASILGFRFNEKIVHDIAFKFSHQFAIDSLLISHHKAVIEGLREGVSSGFIERTKRGFQFSHDKIQSCFRSMISATESAILHQLIGNHFHSLGDPESLYHAANHLNLISEKLLSDDDRIMLCRLNLGAAKFSKEKSAFNKSVEFLRHGLALLQSETKWTDHFMLAFEMTELLAKVELIVGDFQACIETTGEALKRAKSVDQALYLLQINTEVRMAKNEIDDSIITANEALCTLGVQVPRKISIRTVVMKLLKVRALIGWKSDDTILCLHVMCDPRMIAAVRLLFHTSTYCLMKTEVEQHSLFYALLATELTLKFGLSPFSAPAFATYGMIEGFLGFRVRGYRFGKLALIMLDQMKLKEIESPTLNLCSSMCLHFQTPVNDLVKDFDRAMDIGLESGDILWGVYSLSSCIESRCMIGENLEGVEAFQRTNYEKAAEIGQRELLRWSEPSMQYVLNMRSSSRYWRGLITLSGERMNENEYMDFASKFKHELFLSTALFFKMQLAYHFEFYTLAQEYLHDLERTGSAARCYFGAPLWYFLAGSTHYENFLRDPKSRRFHLKAARKYCSYLQKFKMSPNGAPFLKFLAAEKVSSKDRAKPCEVVSAYETAIDAMSNIGWPNMEGLANEKLAFFLARNGDLDLAREYFDRALHLYQHKWAATAKYEWLLENSKRILSESNSQSSRHVLVGATINVHDDQSLLS